MNLTLARDRYSNLGIFSTLEDENGEQIAVTLEHAYEDENGDYSPKLPAGTYTCKLGSHHLDHLGVAELYQIMEVPGHEGILFHVGNYNRDSDGCVLLGTGLGQAQACITASRVAFDKFMTLQGGKDFTLSVVD